MRANWAVKLEQLVNATQGPILFNIEDGQGTGDMVRYHHEALSGIQCQVYRILAFAALAVQEAQLPTGLIDAECTDFAPVTVDGVETIPSTIEGKE
ncbi:hypothetical protein BR1R5_21990 [Pseudomonas sp. BR1R-5]|nr:hypothetical protein BR1R5_21990 [Pseudomonas sp. BR1R-5]